MTKIVFPFVILAGVGLVAGQELVKVEFSSPTACKNNHMKYRKPVKLDQDLPPQEIPQANKIKPSDIAKWKNPTEKVKEEAPRFGKELEWFEVTGKVVLLKAEEDGDLHIQMVDATAPLTDVNIVVEVPVDQTPGMKLPWSSIRTNVFENWMKPVQFPFHITGSKRLNLTKHPVIRVQGKAFFDGEHHGPVDNRRAQDPNVTVWEIHPVMLLEEMK
jgi:hypothetical protein